jgi:iron complex outermembrane receptor protein
MNRALYLIILLLVLSLSSRVNAQNNEHNQILEQAEEDYQIGRFDQILTVLNENLNSFQGNNKQKALRLIALCYLAKDDEKKAEEYARQLITLNNYYSNVDDPIRFEEMVNKLKVGYNYTITTASSVSEDINETPGPMTIITAEMIENLGSNKNLNQILATYVPGMTEIESDYGDNMAMHGAYAQEQELILVMENGHRLNSRSGNDFKRS